MQKRTRHDARTLICLLVIILLFSALILTLRDAARKEDRADAVFVHAAKESGALLS